MSRIGRLPISVPGGVQVEKHDGSVSVRGPRGVLEQRVPPVLEVTVENGTIQVIRSDEQPETRALHGLIRSLLANMVTGVTTGFTKTMEISGVGYRAQKTGDSLILTVGYSHPVEVVPPEGIQFNVETPTRIVVAGIDKQLVGEMAAQIRRVRKPEPYKGKGIRYQNEVIRRKAGKTGRVGK